MSQGKSETRIKSSRRRMIEGDLPKRAEKLVLKWAMLNRSELHEMCTSQEFRTLPHRHQRIRVVEQRRIHILTGSLPPLPLWERVGERGRWTEKYESAGESGSGHRARWRRQGTGPTDRPLRQEFSARHPALHGGSPTPDGRRQTHAGGAAERVVGAVNYR